MRRTSQRLVATTPQTCPGPDPGERRLLRADRLSTACQATLICCGGAALFTPEGAMFTHRRAVHYGLIDPSCGYAVWHGTLTLPAHPHWNPCLMEWSPTASSTPTQGSLP